MELGEASCCNVSDLQACTGSKLNANRYYNAIDPCCIVANDKGNADLKNLPTLHC